MSGILETFLLLFESDADDVRRGTDEANNSAEQLDETLQQIDEDTKKINASTDTMIKMALGALGAFLSVGAALSSINASAELADGLGKAADAIGENVEDLHAWAETVARSGGTVEGFIGTLKNFNTSVVALATTGKGQLEPFFKQLGISAKDSNGKIKGTLQLLPELADKFAKMDSAKSAGLGQKLGLDPGTIALLQSGRRATEDAIRRQKEFGVVTKEQAEIAGKYNDTVDDTKQIMQSLSMSFATSVLPALTKGFEWLQIGLLWVKDNQRFIITFFSAIAAVVTAIYLPAMLSAAAATIAATWPILAIIAACALLALVIDDVIAFINGENSALGELIKQYPLLGEAIDFVVSQFRVMIRTGQAVIQFFKDLWNDPENAVKNFSNTLGKIWDDFLASNPRLQAAMKSITDAFSKVGDAIKGIWDSVKQYFIDMLNGLLGPLNSLLTRLGKEKIEFGGTSPTNESGKPISNADALSRLQDGVAKGQSMISQASNNPLAAQSSNSIANSQSQQVSKTISVNTGDINVSTQATDPMGVANATRDMLMSSFGQGIDQMDDGVAG
ncbi:hypothetical protein LPW36_01950 [Jinshanibacter sp. LJY008]|uniref:Uncharacterized protein n=1 Tax=Limnobaculum eriocheiris TaxID=2897391 RepID=A0A9X1SNC4_9GAMM|nr:hypothetical protein [Limnobaculum eriocheiris]MCD1124807.1 hypothetical protein [Limnobaculum eriocheiris]